MATDPLRKIQERPPGSVLDLDAAEALPALANLPPSTEAPYLTLSLDWRPQGSDPGRTPAPERRRSERRAARDDEGTSSRPARQRFDQEFEEIIARFEPRSDAFVSLRADAERIGTYLDEELDPAAHGVFIVACSAVGVFESLAIGLPLPTSLVVGPTPALFALARLVDDHPTYAVLLADQREATLSFVTQASQGESVLLESTGYPRKQQQGGWSQRRFQARADERVAAFARAIAEETRRVLDEAGVGRLVVAGDEVIGSALDAAFHPTVKERVVASVRLDIGASEREQIEATLPLVQRAEREQEAAAVAALNDALGAGNPGVSGVEKTLTALQGGQVETLLMVDDFAASGWADFSLPVYGVGPVPSAHPAGGDPAALVAVAVEQELVRLAVQTGANVQIVHTDLPAEYEGDREIPEVGSPPPRTAVAAALDELGGVGALLRFTLDQDQSTANL